MGSAHFINMNKDESAFTLPYAQRISMCHEAERSLIYLLDCCKELKVPITKPQSVEKFQESAKQLEDDLSVAKTLLFDKIEESARKDEEFVKQQKMNIDNLNNNLIELKDSLKVYNYVKSMFEGDLGGQNINHADNQIDTSENTQSQALLDNGTGQMGLIAGTINENECERMKRLLFRVTRGLAVTYFQPYEQDGKNKAVYLVIYNNNENDRIKVTKVCESFQGKRTNIPANLQELGPTIQ